MFTNFLMYRADNQIDQLFSSFSFAELEEARKYFSHAYHGLDKIGRPIYIERMGTIDTDKLFKIITLQKLEQYMQYLREDQMKFRFPICSELAGRRIQSVVAIQDLSGASRNIASKLSL